MIEARVAIIIPCYNSQATLTQTLDSALGQSFADLCIVTVNDGSVDETDIILQEYAQRYPEKLCVISQANKGQTIAKNVGIQNSCSEFVVFLDSDDLWTPDKLEKQMALMLSKPNVGLCYTAATQIDIHGAHVGEINVSQALRGKCFNELIVRNNIVASSAMVRRSALEDVGLFDESLRACENWDLWIRIAHGYDVDFVDEPLTCYRLHSNNMSKNVAKILQARLQVIDKHLPAGSNDAWVKEQRSEAFFKTHWTFAKAYVESLQLSEARQELALALKIRPMKVECYILYLKTLLGPELFKKVRARRKDQP